MARRRRLIDFFCGAGGCSVGYARAGFDVVGVDDTPHPEYPFEMIQADAMELIQDVDFLRSFDAVAGSPPCPRYSLSTRPESRVKHPDFVPPFRDAMLQAGVPYIIENVVGAPLLNPVKLCGSGFGLRVWRHRLFESNYLLSPMPCAHSGNPAVGVYGTHPDRAGGWNRPNGWSRGKKATSVAEAQDAMGIDWMSTWSDLADAIPPAYTEHVGSLLLHQLDYWSD